jgi:hypothetical protein
MGVIYIDHFAHTMKSRLANHPGDLMIHVELLREKGILIITPEGALQQSDFESLAQLVDPYIETEGELHGVLIFAESFPGWADFAALLSHLKFVKNHHQHIAKIAAVTDAENLGSGASRSEDF